MKKFLLFLVLFFTTNFIFSLDVYIYNESHNSLWNKNCYEASKRAINIIKNDGKKQKLNIIEIDDESDFEDDILIIFSANYYDNENTISAELITPEKQKSIKVEDFYLEPTVEPFKYPENNKYNIFDEIDDVPKESEEYINDLSQVIAKFVEALFPYIENKKALADKVNIVSELNLGSYYNSEHNFNKKYIGSLIALENGNIIVTTEDGVFAYSDNGRLLCDLTKQINKEFISSKIWKVFKTEKNNIKVYNHNSSYIFDFDQNFNYTGKTKYNFTNNLILNNIYLNSKGEPFHYFYPNFTSIKKVFEDNLVTNKYKSSLKIINGPENTYWIQNNTTGCLLIFVYDENFKIKKIINPDANITYSRNFSLKSVLDDGSFFIEDSSNGILYKFNNDGKPVMGMQTDKEYSYGTYSNGVYYLYSNTGKVLLLAENEKKLPDYLEASKELNKYIANNSINSSFEYSKFLSVAELYASKKAYWQSYLLVSKYLDFCPGDSKAAEIRLSYELELTKELAKSKMEEAIEIFDEYGEETAQSSYTSAMKLIEPFLKIYPNDEELNDMFNELKSTFSGNGYTVYKKSPVLSIENVYIDPIFPALQNFYATNKNGQISIKNNSKAEVKNLKVSTFIRKYMDFPTESLVVEKIKPQETVTINLFNHINNNILTLSENTNSQVQISISWEEEDKKDKLTINRPLTIYNKSSISWADTGMLSCFILPEDENVKHFSYNVLSNTQESFLSKNLTNGISLIEGIKSLNLKYVPDPIKPASNLVDNNYAVDAIKFPSETLELKGGDCDDLTTLFCSILESAGIGTALITTEGHIFAAFDTGLAYNQMWNNLSDELLILNVDGKVWIPIETTKISNGFFESWKTASSELMINNDSFEIHEFVLISEAKDIYPPVNYKNETINLNTKISSVNDSVSNDIKQIKQLFLNKLNEKYETKDPYELNSIAYIFHKMERDTEAIEYLLKAIKFDGNYKSALINLSNLYNKTGNKKESAKYKKLSDNLKNDSSEKIYLRAADSSDEWDKDEVQKSKKGVPVRRSNRKIGSKTTTKGIRTISTRADDLNDDWMN